MVKPNIRTHNPIKHTMLTQGNALLEYTLAGVSVTLVCVAGFYGAGGDLELLFQNLRNEMLYKNHTAIEATTRLGLAKGTTGSSRQGDKGNSLQDLTEAEKILLEANVAKRLQTLGANGTTELLASELAHLADQLLSEGKITSEQSNILMRLANQRYKIAKVERIIEDAVSRSDGTKESLSDMRFDLDGRSYSVMDLASQVGFNYRSPPDYAGISILEDSESAQYHMAEFLKLYTELKESGILADPGVRSVVDQTSAEIAGIGESIESVLYSTMVYDVRIENMNAFRDKLGSHATTIDSGQICTSGKLEHDNTQCKSSV